MFLEVSRVALVLEERGMVSQLRQLMRLAPVRLHLDLQVLVKMSKKNPDLQLHVRSFALLSPFAMLEQLMHFIWMLSQKNVPVHLQL